MENIISSRAPLPISVVLVGVAIGALFLRLVLRSWDLRHIPGPFAAKMTDFWFAFKYWRGELFPDMALDLHRKYGPVVRYGPRRVLFSDPSAVNVIFNTKHALRKVAISLFSL